MILLLSFVITITYNYLSLHKYLSWVNGVYEEIFASVLFKYFRDIFYHCIKLVINSTKT